MAKFIAKDWSLAKLQALPVEEQDKMARSYVAIVGTVKEKREDERETAIVVGKLLYVLEERLNAGKTALPGRPAVYASNKSLAELFKDVTGAKPPTHALTLKNAFAFVPHGFITEADYDANSSNCLQLAARILDVAKKFDHPAVAKAIAELKERSKNEAKNLRDIYAALKPQKPMSAEDAITAIGDVYDAGHGLLIFAESADNILARSDAEFAQFYVAAARLVQNLDEKMPASVRAQVELATARPVEIRPNSTAPVPPEETDETVLDQAPADHTLAEATA